MAGDEHDRRQPPRGIEPLEGPSRSTRASARRAQQPLVVGRRARNSRAERRRCAIAPPAMSSRPRLLRTGLVVDHEHRRQGSAHGFNLAGHGRGLPEVVAPVDIVRRPDPSALPLDDRAADGETESQYRRLGGDERFRRSAPSCRADSGAGVIDGDVHVAAIRAAVWTTTRGCRSIGPSSHPGVDPRLRSTCAAGSGRRARARMRARSRMSETSCRIISPRRARDLRRPVVDISTAGGRFGLPQQSAHPPDHFAARWSSATISATISRISSAIPRDGAFRR